MRTSLVEVLIIITFLSFMGLIGWVMFVKVDEECNTRCQADGWTGQVLRGPELSSTCMCRAANGDAKFPR